MNIKVNKKYIVAFNIPNRDNTRINVAFIFVSVYTIDNYFFHNRKTLDIEWFI